MRTTSGVARRAVRRPVKRALRALGYRVVPAEPPLPADFEAGDVRLWRSVAPYTMTSPDCVRLLADAVRHVVATGIPGAVVECGVWRGGSMMAVAGTLCDLGCTDRDLYLFDTFTGMTDPTDKDVHRTGRQAAAMLADEARADPAASLLWARAPLDGVRHALASTGYPPSRLFFVRGKVEDTVPSHAPDEIALLRLDTDWYASTRHELVHLYPRLVPGGLLIIDDYGVWHGSGAATDEYFEQHGPRPFLCRVDDGGARLAVKPSESADGVRCQHSTRRSLNRLSGGSLTDG